MHSAHVCVSARIATYDTCEHSHAMHSLASTRILTTPIDNIQVLQAAMHAPLYCTVTSCREVSCQPAIKLHSLQGLLSTVGAECTVTH